MTNHLLEDRRATREHDIGVQILADVDVILVDETWLEQHSRTTEAFGANRDDVPCGGATTLIFIADEADAVCSYPRSRITWNMVVPPESTTLAYKSLRM